METVEYCRILGRTFERPPKAEYYGFACTSVLLVEDWADYELAFTPILDKTPINYSHCDVYDNGNPPIQSGVALPSKMNLERERFIKRWNPFWDDENFIFDGVIEPPSNVQ